MRKHYISVALLTLMGFTQMFAAYGEGWHASEDTLVTAAVTDPLLPWRPEADIVGTERGIVFANLFFTKKECDAFLKTAPFKNTLAGVAGFMTLHIGALAKPKCVQVIPGPDPKVPDVPEIKAGLKVEAPRAV